MPRNPSDSNGTSFSDFCKTDSVAYWRTQLSPANTKNIKNESQLGGTRNAYAYSLLAFHNWLADRQFQYVTSIPTGKNTVRQCRINTSLNGVSHLLELSKKCNTTDKTDFVLLIKEYLAELASNKSQSTVKNSMYSIRSFFRENQSDMPFLFMHRIKRNNKNHIKKCLSLDQLHDILSDNDIQPMERAVFLCKFHRGLDSSTFADRFNFEIWENLLRHFGSDRPESWDLNDTPVPISLVRVKTGFAHTGFLDVDAVISIIHYLKARQNRPEIDHALFVDTRKKPITVNWISRRFHKLITRYRSKHNTPEYPSASRCTSHELRDLLKSTMIDSGCRADIADHVIGHAPKDSYEKQTSLYPESVMREFTKVSERINIFTGSKHNKHQKHVVYTEHDDDRSHNLIHARNHITTIQNMLETHEKRLLEIERIIS